MTSIEEAKEIEQGKRISAALKIEGEKQKAAEAKAAEYRERGLKQLMNAAHNLLESEGHRDLDGVQHCKLSETLISLARYVEHGGHTHHENPFARPTRDLLRELAGHVANAVRIH